MASTTDRSGLGWVWRNVLLKRGAQLEFSTPLPLTVSGPVIVDGAGSAIGDATASGGLDALASFAGSAIGDSIASGGLSALADFAGAASGDSEVDAEGADGRPVPFYYLFERGAKQALGRGPRVEFQSPLPLLVSTPATTADGAGSAIGDATASGSLSALASFAGAATGDATASGGLSALADFAGSATGDATASATGTSLADAAGSAIGDAIAAATGATNNFQDCAGSAIGDATCNGFIEDATPAVVTPPAVAQQSFPGAWGRPVRKRKKRLDDLDEMIAELRSRIEEVPVESTAEDIYQRALRVSQALANQPDPSLREIDNQIVLLREAIQEIDDEEAVLLLAA